MAEFSDIASGKDDHRPGFRASLTRFRQLGAMLAAARLDRITQHAHTLSHLPDDGYSVRPANMAAADDLMMRVHAAMAQKERELSLKPTRAALTAGKARGVVIGSVGRQRRPVQRLQHPPLGLTSEPNSAKATVTVPLAATSGSVSHKPVRCAVFNQSPDPL